MDSWIFRKRLQGSKLIGLNISLYYLNFLELRCLKWVCMTHLGTQNTSYGQMKGRESIYQFDSRPLKVRFCSDLLACKWRVTYCWKSLDKGYNFALNLTSIEGLQKKLWTSKVVGVPIQWISRLWSWESQDKMTFGCWPRGQAQRIL
jgi:hypothetical protein